MERIRLREFIPDSLQGDNNIPFGGKLTWDAEDKTSPITNPDFQSKDLEISLLFSNIDEEAVEDSSGLDYKGILFNDYKVKYERNTRIPDKTDTLNKAELGTDDTEKPF